MLCDYSFVKYEKRFFILQNDACRKAAQGLEKKYPESDFPILIQAAVLFREKQHQDAVNTLEASDTNENFVVEFRGCIKILRQWGSVSFSAQSISLTKYCTIPKTSV